MDIFGNFEMVFFVFVVMFSLLGVIFLFLKNDTVLIDFSLDSLEERYAKGEITKEKFEQMKKFVNKEFEHISKLIHK